MSDDDLVLYEVTEGVALLTLNRPSRLNAWTVALESAYFDRLVEARDDPAVRVVVVTGAGRGFCAGADMDRLQALTGDGPREQPRRTMPVTFPLSMPKLMIAAVNGACAGIGLIQALMCDVRFAAAGAKFTTAFTRRGTVAEQGCSWLLPRMIGIARALDLLLSSRVILAEEALEIGLVNRVLAGEDLLSDSMSYARDVADNCSPSAVAAVKSQVYRHATVDFETARRESNKLAALALRGPDFEEGVASFVEKRQVNFPPLGRGTSFED